MHNVITRPLPTAHEEIEIGSITLSPAGLETRTVFVQAATYRLLPNYHLLPNYSRPVVQAITMDGYVVATITLPRMSRAAARRLDADFARVFAGRLAAR